MAAVSAAGLTAAASVCGHHGRRLLHTLKMAMRQVGELTGEDDDLFGLGGVRRFAPRERGGHAMLGRAAALGETAAAAAKRRLSERREDTVL